MLASMELGPAGSHADPVVPVLLALVLLTLGAVIGGRLMTWMKQPAVLGELIVGLIGGNLGYYFGNRVLTVLREGDNLRRISDLALTSSISLTQAVHQILPATDADRVAAALSGPQSLDYMAVYTFVDFLARIAILILLFLVGLETSLAEMRRVGKTALLVAVAGIVAQIGRASCRERLWVSAGAGAVA